MFVVHSGFINNHKLGDNIVSNLESLNRFYEHLDMLPPAHRKAYYKPATILIGSVLEAVLYDFYQRVKTNILEGVPTIPGSRAREISSKKRERFKGFIDGFREYGIIDITWHVNIYDRMLKVKDLRSRFHIQNDKSEKPLEEEKIFTFKALQESEETLEIVLKFMPGVYRRPPHTKHVSDFKLPWAEHQPDFMK